jgi:penicillin-binding protein 2
VTLLSVRREVGEFKKRYSLEHDAWAEIARENITKRIPLPATRGILRDAAGRVIATNRPSYDVFVTPHLLDPEGDEPDPVGGARPLSPVAARIADLMGFDGAARDAFAARLAKIPSRRRTHQIEMFTEISRDQLAAIEQHATSRGRRGELRVLVDVAGRHRELTDIDDLAGQAVRRDPVPGRDVTLTLDMELMRIIDRAFRGHPSGAAVVVEARTGRVRALYSKPAYDLNEISGHLSREEYAELVDNPFRPLIDKTIYETYFPGSTFKPFAAFAALGTAGFDSAARVECQGVYEIGHERKRCTQVHGEVDMRQAIVRSCNVYFYRLAEQVGLNALNASAADFGFGAPSGIGINTEAHGFLASREWYERHFGRWRTGFTLNTAIGQGNTRVSLLQLALSYAAIANGGTLYHPQIVESVREPGGTVLERFEPRVRRRIGVAREHLAYVVDGLYGVVNDPTGTAYDSRIDGGVPIAGKTGTAEVQGRSVVSDDPRRAWYFRRDHAWFAGFAPAGDPEIAIVVLVEHGGGGGRFAAPVAIQIVQEYLGGRASGEGAPTASIGGGATRRPAAGGR